MKLGLFLMPLHDPDKPLAPFLAEDRACVIELDKLGYDEVFVGEHYTATSEPITDPLQFLATLIPETRSIKLGTGVFNLPQHHPLQIAGNAALFDNLSGGRLLMGIGPGGLGRSEEHTSDLQLLMRISYDVFCLKAKKSKNILYLCGIEVRH